MHEGDGQRFDPLRLDKPSHLADDILDAQRLELVATGQHSAPNGPAQSTRNDDRYRWQEQIIDVI
ncbi:MAG: hypothetical protein U1E02_30850, partial [Hydrogenophaga sp.]|nr:hypothetical protein [Hydrogenophaga sp.]